MDHSLASDKASIFKHWIKHFSTGIPPLLKAFFKTCPYILHNLGCQPHQHIMISVKPTLQQNEAKEITWTRQHSSGSHSKWRLTLFFIYFLKAFHAHLLITGSSEYLLIRKMASLPSSRKEIAASVATFMTHPCFLLQEKSLPEFCSTASKSSLRSFYPSCSVDFASPEEQSV